MDLKENCEPSQLCETLVDPSSEIVSEVTQDNLPPAVRQEILQSASHNASETSLSLCLSLISVSLPVSLLSLSPFLPLCLLPSHSLPLALSLYICLSSPLPSISTAKNFGREMAERALKG